MDTLRPKLIVKPEKKFWQSSNFWTAVITLLVILLASFGVMVPEDLFTDIKDSIFPSFDPAKAIIAVFTLTNSLYQLFKKEREEPSIEQLEEIAKRIRPAAPPLTGSGATA